VGKIYPFDVVIPAGIGGLKKDSKVVLDQIRSLDKTRLVRKIGTLKRVLLSQVCTIAQKLLSPE
jgi:mRNA interferase MazF